MRWGGGPCFKEVIDLRETPKTALAMEMLPMSPPLLLHFPHMAWFSMRKNSSS